MAEDTKKPSRTVPLAMFWSVVATYLMGWVSICVLLAVSCPAVFRFDRWIDRVSSAYRP